MEAFGGMLALSMVLGIAFVGVLVLALVAIVTGRGEPDPDARRIPTLYAATIGFLALFTLLFAAFATVESLLTAAIAEDDTSVGFESSPFSEAPPGEGWSPFFGGQGGEAFEVGDDGDDEHYATAVQSGLVALAAAGVFLFHRRLLTGTDFGDPRHRSAAWRVYQAFLYAVCFVAVLTALFTAASAIYGLFRVVAPGVTGLGDDDFERRAGLVQFLATGLLAAAAVALYRLHWDEASRLEQGPVTASPGAGPSERPPGAPPPPPSA